MNKQEINEMMKDLPSQQLPEETLFQKVIIATIFIVILFLVMWVPDFTLDEEDRPAPLYGPWTMVTGSI